MASTSTNSSIGLIIFDCDGILVDSESLSVDINRAMLREKGWSLSREEAIERFLGTSMAHVQKQLEVHTGRPVPDSWAADVHDRNEAAFEQHLRAIPHVREALRSLDDIPRCVASSSSPRRIQHSLELVDLWREFDPSRVFSASMVANGKPAPDLFLHAADSCKVTPDRCVVVEDSRFGVRAAVAAGMRVFGYAGGLTPSAMLADEGAVLFEDMRELPDLIRGLE